MKKMRIVQFTDTHLISTKDGKHLGVDTSASLRDAFYKSRLLEQQPDAVFVTGDLAEDGSLASYIDFKEIFEGVELPVFVVPGNHDNLPTMQQVFNGTNIQIADYADFGEWLAILVNSNVNGKSYGYISEVELQKIEKGLSHNRHKSIMLALHHPPLSVCPSSGCQLKNQDTFKELIGRYDNVKVVLSGHLHLELDEEIEDVRILCAPSTFALGIHPTIDQDVDFEDFWASHKLDVSRQGFRVVDLFDAGDFRTEVHWI